jgi:peptidoglycan/xylan/chitin deacetylase (PgdA/CDA1 family)
MILPSTVPRIIQKLFPRRVWQLDTDQKIAYISFDDGPHERITPMVLQLLKKHDALATFFCIGDRVNKHPECFEQIKKAGHAVGNHTYQHVNGWKTDLINYMEDVQKADALIGSKIFRPPYGRLTSAQFQRLEVEGYKTIMWTILSGDYDKRLSPDECTKRVLNSLKPGAIILFHDSEKAEKNMMVALGNLLEEGISRGYVFKSLNIN